MSKQIEERVVSMQFDNSRFEKNVSTSMNTLDKLKEKLNLKGASQGLEEVNKAANKVDMSGLGEGVDAVQVKFSALQVVAVQTLSRIYDKVLDVGAKLHSSTIGSITSGGYNRAMNLENARFQLKGLLKDEEKVAAVMQNVNDAVDGTAYSLDAAASVASQLAASGMEAGDSMFTALRGVAGVAAMTNSSYEEIGRIYTQVASQGRLMGDQLLQLSSRGMNAAATLAEYLGKTEAEVRDMTSKGEISFETFAAAMDNAFGEHAKEANNTLQGAFSNIKSALARIGAEFVSPLIKEKGPLVQFLNIIRERINDIKTNIVPIAEAVTTRINKFITAINNLLKKGSILGDGFSSLSKKLSGLMEPVDNTVDTVKKAVDTVKDYASVVNEIINGDWGNGQSRWDKLTEAGYDWAHAQNLVNEKLGDSTRHATDYKEAQDAATKSTAKATEVDAERIAELCKLSDAELEALGYTKEQIEAFRELEKAAKKVGLPISEFIKNIDNIDDKWLLLESFANIGRSLTGIFKTLKEAWQEIFNPNNESIIQKIASKIFDLISAFHKFTRSLLLTDTETGKLNENGEKLKRTFKGIFAIFDIVKTIVGGPLKLTFKILNKILGAFGFNILDITAYIGDAIVKFRDWFKSVFDFDAIIEKITPYIKTAASAIRDWISSVKDSKIVKSLTSWLKESGIAIKDWIAGLKETDNIPKYIIEGLWNGLKNGVSKIAEIAIELGKKILESIKKVLGIHSPSKEMEKVGENTIDGFVQGIKNGFTKVWEALKNFGSKCIEIVKNIDFGALLGVGIIASVLIVANKLVNVLDKLVNPLGKLGGMFENIGTGIKNMCTSIGTNFKAKAFERISNALLNFAKAIGILVVSVIALSYVAKNNSGDMWETFGMIASLAAVLTIPILALAALAVICKKQEADFENVVSVFGKIGRAFLAIAIAIVIFNKISWTALGKAGATLSGLLVFVIAIAILAQKCKKIAAIEHIISTFGKITKAFLAIAAATFIFNLVSWTALGKAGATLSGLLVFVGIIALIANKCKGIKGVNTIDDTLWNIAKSMAILALVVKILGSITWPHLGVAAVGMLGLLLVVGYLMKMLNKYSKDAPNMGKTLLAIAGAMAILAAIAVIIGLMKFEHLAQGVGGIAVLGIIMAILIKVASKAENAMKPVLAMAALIAVLGTILILLAKLTDTTQLITAAACLAGVVIVLAAAMAIIGKFGGGLAGGGALLLAAAGLLVIAAAMWVLAAIPGDKIAQSIGLIVVALLALCAVAAIFHFFIAGATALVGVLLGIAAIVVAVGIAAIAFAGALYIVGLALPLVADGLVYLITSLAGCYEHAGKFVVVCLALFAGLILLAIPIVIIAAGILLIGVAFTLVAVSALVFVAALTILALILPLLSVGLEQLCNVILQFSDRAGEILVTMLALAAGIAALGLAAIIAGAGVIVFGVGLAICAVALVVVAVAALLLVAALWAISYILPSLVENIASCSGSMDDFKNVMSTVGSSVLEFLLKLAGGLVAFGLGAIVGAAGAGVLAIGIAVLSVAILIGAVAVLALAAAFYLLGKALDVTVQAAEAGKNLVLGFAQGIINSISTVINTVKDFCGTVVGKVKEFLGIHSPSTIMQALGLNTGEGFALGLDDSKAGVAESAEGLAQTAKDGMSDAGAEGGSAFSTGLGDSLDLSSLGDGLDLETLKSQFSSAGSEGGSSFTSGLGDSLDLSSLTSGEGLDFSSLTSSFGSAGSDSGSAFNTGLLDGLGGSDGSSSATSSITADIDANKETVTSKFKSLGSESATAFKTGLTDNLDLSQVNIGTLDLEAIKGQFSSAGTNSGTSFATALSASLQTVTINNKLNTMLNTIIGYNPKMKQAGTNLGKYFCTGLKAQKEATKKAAKALASSAVSSIKTQTQYDKMVSAGKYLGAGLVEGINAKWQAVYDAAFELGQAAVQGEKDGQESNSPSKATIQAGKWLGEGLIIGIKNMGSAVSKAGNNLGEMATGTISKAVANISDAINSDIDAQPTIRPVLDLSGVRAGAGSINALFSGRTLAVDMAGVSAVSASMPRRQNGNSELASAINKLAKSNNNKTGDTYNINGVNYSEGSDVSDAIKTLVRATKMDGRT